MKLALIELANKWKRHANSLIPSGGAGGCGRVEHVGAAHGGSMSHPGDHAVFTTNQTPHGVEGSSVEMGTGEATNLAVAGALSKCSSELKEIIKLLSE